MGLLHCHYDDLGLGVVGVLVEDGTMVGAIYQTGPTAWCWQLHDDASGIGAFAQGVAVTEGAAKCDLVGAAIDRVIETIF